MDGYQMSADSYKRLLEADKSIDRESTERKIKALEIMANTDRQTQCEVFNTGGFNDIAKGYFLMALDNLQTDHETRNNIMREIRFLFDTVTAEQAAQYYTDH